jgi:hypothetical protein
LTFFFTQISFKIAGQSLTVFAEVCFPLEEHHGSGLPDAAGDATFCVKIRKRCRFCRERILNT